MGIPQSLKFASSHEWIKIHGTKAVVGISDFAQNELGDIVFVELPEVGKQVKAGEACSVIESVKTASDVYSPLSGTITAVNDKLTDHPELINEDCFGQGWIFELDLTDPSEDNGLVGYDEYKQKYAY